MRYLIIFVGLILIACTDSASELHADGMNAYISGDYETAADLLRKSANLGDHDSQAILGSMYILGQGVSQDREKAAMLLLPAAESGHPYAEVYMGVLYFTGDGTATDIEQARYWLEKAAAKGDNEATDLLSRLPPE